MSNLTIKPKEFVAYPDKAKELEQLATDYKDLVITRKTFNDAKVARRTLREERYAIQRIEKENNAILNDLKRQNKSMSESLIEIMRSTEDVIDAKIKEIEEQKRLEAEKKKKAREELVKKQTEMTASILDNLTLINYSNNIDDIEKILTSVEGLKITKKAYGEFYETATGNVDVVIKSGYERIEVIKKEKEAIKQAALDAYLDYFGKPAPTEDVEVIYSLISDDKKQKEAEKKKQAIKEGTPDAATAPAEKRTQTVQEVKDVVEENSQDIDEETEKEMLRYLHSYIQEFMGDLSGLGIVKYKSIVDKLEKNLNEVIDEIENVL